MNVILEQVHSFFAYLFLIFTALTVGYALVNLFRKESYSATQFGLAKASFIASHCQLLIGLVVWFRMNFISVLQTNAKDIMSNPLARLIAIEHPLVNIIGIILITIGYISIKKSEDDRTKRLKNLIFYGIGLLLILSRIPWHLWLD